MNSEKVAFNSNYIKGDIRCAIIIVTFNSAEYLDECIESAIKFSGKNDLIVVVDNFSSDGTKEIIQKHAGLDERIKTIYLTENVGFGRANNFGFELVEAEWYFLLNADAWMLADSISPCLYAMQIDKKVKICGIPLIYPDGRPQNFAYAFTSWKKWILQIVGAKKIVLNLIKSSFMKGCLERIPSAKNFIGSQSREVLSIKNYKNSALEKIDFSGKISDADWVCGAAMIIDGDFIRDIGGFDPKIFLYGEDEDLCLVAYNQGGKVIYCDVSPVVHVFGWGKNRFNPVVAKMKYDSLSYFIYKNYTGVSKIMMTLLLPLHVYGIRFWHVFKK